MIMSEDPDYYRILHVQPDAPMEIINASYRTLMQRLRNHPDLGGDHERAVLLNEAYAVLTNPERRAAYDSRRDISASSRFQQPAFDATDTLSRTDEAFAAFRCLFCGIPHKLERAIQRDDECATCSSPLFPAERHRHDYSGQRMLARIPRARSIRLCTGWPQREAFVAQMRDISLNGMQVVTEQKLSINQLIKIECDVCRAIGRVAHCRPSGSKPGHWVTGVEFVTLHFTKNSGSFISARA